MVNDLREFTKSFVRFSWALTAFGVSRAADIADLRGGLRAATSAMDSVSHSAERTLGEVTDDVYRAGDHLQSGLFDAAWDLAAGSWSNPDAAMRKAWRAVDESWSKVREVAGRRR